MVKRFSLRIKVDASALYDHLRQCSLPPISALSLYGAQTQKHTDFGFIEDDDCVFCCFPFLFVSNRTGAEMRQLAL